MLVRTLLAIETEELALRTASLLSELNALVLPAKGQFGMWEGLARESCDLLIVEPRVLPEPMLDLIATLRKLPDRPEIIVLQALDDASRRAAFLAAGCLAVISPDLPDLAFAQTLKALVNRRRETLMQRLRAERPESEYRLADFVTSSPLMERLLDLSRRVAHSDSSLLILGETGVGKEWLAKAIHNEGRRSSSPFIAINCAAVPDSLLESELFGHERGAFTGAMRSRRGHFELAHGGTIFLDEIGDMSPTLQAKLLRVLQERKIQRVGSESVIEVDVRIMAATNRDLEEAMQAKAFRPDLYYRLGVVNLTIPPLRTRREDVPFLAQSYLSRFRQRLGRQIHSLSEDATAALSSYDWPGNVRELINVIERAVLLCHGPDITLEDLPDNIARGARSEHSGGTFLEHATRFPEAWLEKHLKDARQELIDAFERAYLIAQLERHHGKIGETALAAGLDPRSIYDKMKRLGLTKDDFKG
jgi:two-component system, NtrC family, response regulator AtoC